MSRPAPGATATKRIKKEIADLAKENLGQITLTPNESNIFMWRATLPGPVGSPYEGGEFEVDIRVPADYPFSPPQLTFLTKVYHCNIAHNGTICLDLLKTAWSPALSLYKVILSLSSLLTDPNPADPLVGQIAQEYKRSRSKHDATAREWVKLYAQPKKPVAAPPPAPAASTSSSSRPAQPRLKSFIRPEASTPSASGSSTPAPAGSVAGVRRTHAQANGNGAGSGASRTGAINIDDDDDVDDVVDDGEIEMLGTGGNGIGSRSSSRVNGSEGAGAGAGRRSAKRARGNGGDGGMAVGSRDDEIVID